MTRREGEGRPAVTHSVIMHPPSPFFASVRMGSLTEGFGSSVLPEGESLASCASPSWGDFR